MNIKRNTLIHNILNCDQGHENAKYSYAMSMKRGSGFEKADLEGSAIYFKQVINQYRHMIYTYILYKQAHSMLIQLFDSKHAWGTYAYADALSKGEGVRKNESKAFELFKLCADSKIPPAYFAVANMYSSGKGVEKVCLN